MPHIKFDPMKELEFLSQRMKKFADEFPETFSFEFGKGFDPKADLVHDKENVMIFIELPGMEKTQVSLSYAEGILTISGNKAAPEVDESLSVVRAERSFGEFRRELALPVEIDSDSLSARMSNGVLTVTMRKKSAPEKSERTITID